MTDRPRIPLAGVIGSPVSHSKSPKLHHHWLKAYGIRGHYVPMDVAQADLKAVIAALPKAGFVGCNVTIPHKETVLARWPMWWSRPRAALIGAANTLIFRKDGRLRAGNADGYGFIANLRQNAPSWNPEARAGSGDRRRRRRAGRHRLADRSGRAGDPPCQPHAGAGRSASSAPSLARRSSATGFRPAICSTARQRW